MPSPGLAPGDKAPDFTLPNALGQDVSLSDALRRGPVVLTFYRGAWCPYCNLELRALQESLPAFEQRGATLIAVTPQKPDKSREQIQKESYGFEILSDLDSAVMKKYKLYFELPKDLAALYREKFGIDVEAYNGEGRAVLPVPGTFVLDRDGIVRAAYANTDYTQRMEPADIVAALDKIAR
jgi:peroxiredoxin